MKKSAGRDGKPRTLTAEQEAARRRSLKRLRKGWPLGLGRVDRDAFHDRQVPRPQRKRDKDPLRKR